MTTRPSLSSREGAPGLQLELVDSDDEPFEDGAGGARRPSTASLSRFRSCPQLSSADTHAQDSPGSDDHPFGAELCVTGHHPGQGSPRAHQKFQRDEGGAAGGRSQTPTPPSTPGSRRSHVSLEKSLGPGGKGENASGPASKLVGRARMEHALFGRTASTDHDSGFRFASDDNYLRADIEQSSERGSRLSEFFEEPPDISIDDRLTATEDGASTPAGAADRRFHADESMDKCARWLQSLKMTSSDRLKSRSHIQLPPI
ncbi:hypothetical protein BaRGS_00000122 [Batillaria attramentaria]|uniref:Uncharacterized protein n=1 Tax=Batillaria attramentaria TaxID=370345 RepID=A0ABD0MB72_9CAEN